MKKAFAILPLICGILWGTTGVFVRILGDASFDSPTILFTRTSIATVLLLIGLGIYKPSLLKIKLKDIWIFILCSVGGMLFLNLCYNLAIEALSLSFAAVLLSMAPIFALAFGALFFKEKLTLRKGICALLAICGCFLVSGVIESSAQVTAIGLICGLGAGFFYALNGVFTKFALQREYHSFTITFYSMAIATIALIPFVDFGSMAAYVCSAPVKSISIMVTHSLCSSVIPYLLLSLSLTQVEVGPATIMTAAGEPSAAMVFGAIFFSELPSALNIVGLAAVVIAVIALNSKSRSESD